MRPFLVRSYVRLAYVSQATSQHNQENSLFHDTETWQATVSQAAAAASVSKANRARYD